MSCAIRCVLFDLDGTLIDTAPDLAGAANHVRGTLGMAPLALADYRSSASAGARGMLRVALGISPDDADFLRQRALFLDYYSKHLADHSSLFDGLDALLLALTAREVKWGVATNKPSCYTTPLMQALKLDQRSAATVSADEVANPKPAPDCLLLACARAGVSADSCLYVGDDKRDIDAGRAAGMRTVAAAWGYEGEYPLASWNADFSIQHPSELLGLLAPAA